MPPRCWDRRRCGIACSHIWGTRDHQPHRRSTFPHPRDASLGDLPSGPPGGALLWLASGMALISTGEAPDALVSGVAKLQAALLPEGQPLAVDLPTPPPLG